MFSPFILAATNPLTSRSPRPSKPATQTKTSIRSTIRWPRHSSAAGEAPSLRPQPRRASGGTRQKK